MLVNIVGQNPHMRVAQQHIRQCANFCARVHRTGRIVRRIKQQPFGAWRDRRFQLRWRELEAALRRALHFDRHAVGHQHHVQIRNPVRRGNNRLITRPDGCHHRVENNLFTAGANHDLVGVVLQPVLTLEFNARRFFQLGNAINRRILGFIAHQGIVNCAFDVLRRIEVRLTNCQRNDVLALRPQFTCALRSRSAGRKFNAIQPIGIKTHGNFLYGAAALLFEFDALLAYHPAPLGRFLFLVIDERLR